MCIDTATIFHTKKAAALSYAKWTSYLPKEICVMFCHESMYLCVHTFVLNAQWKKNLCVFRRSTEVSCMYAPWNSVAMHTVNAVCCTRFPFCSPQCFWNQLKSKHPGRKVQFLHPWFQLFLNLTHKHSFLRYVSGVPNKDLLIFLKYMWLKSETCLLPSHSIWNRTLAQENKPLFRV